MRTPLLFALLLAPAAAGAQSLYKCTDARGQVTYSNIACDKQGLKAAGLVTEDRVTTMPLPPAAKPAPKPPVEMPKDEAAADAKGAAVKPASPLIEKLAK